MFLCKVIVDVAVRQVNHHFSYTSHVYIEKYSRVKVNFGRREVFAILIDCQPTSLNQKELEVQFGYRLGKIISIIDHECVLSDTQIQIVEYLNKHSFTPLINCFKAVLPPSNKLSQQALDFKFKTDTLYHALSHDIKLSSKQQECYDMIKNHDTILRKDLLLHYSSAVIKGCIDKKVIGVSQKRVLHSIDTYHTNQSRNFVLNEEQTKAYHSVITGVVQHYLLHGVTGSGKTEVYIKLCEHYLQQGKQVLILIPEITLSLQLYSRFKHYFEDQVVLLHSKLSINEKNAEYERISQESASIIIGTRSAVFARLDRLALIIVDEFHDDSFSQTTAPRYQIQDIAKLRVELQGAKLLLASATPDIVTYAMMKKGHFESLTLNHKFFEGPKTKCHVIDMKKAYETNQFSVLSNELYDAMKHAFAQGKQVILLINRRGYSLTVICQNCYTIKKCVHCDVALVYHQDTQTYRCHYCDYQEQANSPCHKCHHTHYNYMGIGIQKVEEFCNRMFTDIGILRMDADTTRKKGATLAILDAFKNKKASLLIGTQMVAKGLDFDDVALVGIINADSTLMLPHFCASEKTFQLLVQVMGRCGRRSDDSDVFIQTLHPDHYSIEYALTNDYDAFFEREMNYRKMMKYPPYFQLAKIKISGKHYTQVQDMMFKVHGYLQQSLPSQCYVTKPSESYGIKQKDIHQFELLIKYKFFSQVETTFEELNHFVENKFMLQINIQANEL